MSVCVGEAFKQDGASVAFFEFRITALFMYKFEEFFSSFFVLKIPSFLENSYQECEEIVRSFLCQFRLVPHNVKGIFPT